MSSRKRPVRIDGTYFGPNYRITPCFSGGYILISGGKWIAQGPLPEMKRIARHLFS